MLFAWLPFVGDALCVAAGWVKMNWIAAMFFQAAGHFVRHWLISIGAL
jgi:membrane protein YqaA with SNARE-associated domain